MSQTTEDQTTTTTPPTSEEVIGKVNESIAALQTAQQTVVEGANLLGEHVNDPSAHGAGVLENIRGEMPQPAWDGTSLKFQKADGTEIVAPVNLKGEPGTPGPAGPRPEHQWEGTRLKIQNADGTWPESGINLKGEPGEAANLSDAVDNDISSTAASSRAVKITHDKALAAQNTADTAKATADNAMSTAITVQATANAAKTSAESALAKAEEALEAAGGEGSSGGLDPGGTPLCHVYTESATFTVPYGITKLLVVCIGAGAKGGYTDTTNGARAAGGTGGVAASVYVTVTPGQQIPVTVGTTSARTSSFGEFLSCSDSVTTSLAIQMQGQAGLGGYAWYDNPLIVGGGGGGFNPPNWHAFALAGPGFLPKNGTSQDVFSSADQSEGVYTNGGAGYGNNADGRPSGYEYISGGSVVPGRPSGNFLRGGDGGAYGGGGGAIPYTYYYDRLVGQGGPGAVVVLW